MKVILDHVDGIHNNEEHNYYFCADYFREIYNGVRSLFIRNKLVHY